MSQAEWVASAEWAVAVGPDGGGYGFPNAQPVDSEEPDSRGKLPPAARPTTAGSRKQG